MKGVQFLVDDEGRRTAALIDLRRHSDLWEDFFDSALARSREKEPRETLEAVRNRLRRKSKLPADA